MKLRALGCAALVLSLAACGDDAGGGGVTESPNLGDKAEAAIVAADGGEVELTEAGIKLEIPAGSLKSDETITAEVVSKTGLPEASSLAGNVLELGPDGLTFAMPVEISIEMPEGSVPESADKVKLVWLDTEKDEWVELPENKYEGGVVTAKTSHFSIFAVRFVVDAEGNVVQEGGQCTGAFDACGGDIEGTWKITSGCGTVGGLDELKKQCSGLMIDIAVDMTGDITIQGGEISGEITVATDIQQSFPKSCLGGSCPAPDPEDPEATVFEDKGETCEASEMTTDVQDVASTYEVSGSKLIITDDTSTEPEEHEFCVKGDTLTVRLTQEDGSVMQYTAKRQ